jgi:hypothetical protein
MGKTEASEHPEYIRLMSQLDQSKNERLQKVENWRNFELQSIHDWFAAQKKQAWDDFYVSCVINFHIFLPLLSATLHTVYIVCSQKSTLRSGRTSTAKDH